MNRELRRVGIVVLLMFVSLFVSTSVIQVFQVDALRPTVATSGRSTKATPRSAAQILVDGEAIAALRAGRRPVQVPAGVHRRSALRGGDRILHSRIRAPPASRASSTTSSAAARTSSSSIRSRRSSPDRSRRARRWSSPSIPRCSRPRGMHSATSPAPSWRSTPRPAGSLRWSRSRATTRTSLQATTSPR